MPAPAHPLLRATARLRALAGRPVVVKLGGSAMEDPAATRGTLEAVVALHALRVKLVVVHGGGRPIDRAMEAAGLVPKKVAGRRVTDDAAVGIVVRVLGEISTALLAGIRGEWGGRAVADAGTLFGERLVLTDVGGQPVDLGHVGTITRVDTRRIRELVGGGVIVVLPSLALPADGGPGHLNVNADTAAAAVAGALQADTCLFLTDTPGVLRSVSDPGSLIRRLTRAEADALIRDGTVGGGMVPKLEACFEALDAGAGAAVILDGRNPHALLDWQLGEPAGTEIVP